MSRFLIRKAASILPSRAAAEDGRHSLIAELWGWAKSIAVAVLLVVLLHQFVFNLSNVKGHSMEPTLRENEWVFVNKIATYAASMQRGDIVILKNPVPESGDHLYLVKRVVAVGGDRVEVSGGKLYVNGQPVEESYTDSAIEDGRYGPITVAPGCYFVMGDNRHRNGSLDSRTFGPVPERMVMGRVDWIVWPFRQAHHL